MCCHRNDFVGGVGDRGRRRRFICECREVRGDRDWRDRDDRRDNRWDDDRCDDCRGTRCRRRRRDLVCFCRED